MKRDDIARKIADLELLAGDEDLKPAQVARLEQKIAAEQMALKVVEAKIEMQSSMEARIWAELWRTPQAAAWASLGWTRDVATYARLSVLAELGDMKALQEARMWSDRLGLTPMAMLWLRWKVAADEVGAKRDEGGPRAGNSRARRGPLTAVGD